MIRRLHDTADLSWSMVQQGPGDPPPPAPPTPPAPPPSPPTPPRHVADPAAEITRLNDTIANTRAEAAAHRVNANQANEQVAIANARIAELQVETERRVQETRSQMSTEFATERQARIASDVRLALRDAGITIDPSDAAIIMQGMAEGRAITVKDGVVSGLTEAITAFRAAKPSYFAAPTQPSPPAPPVPRAPGAPGAPPANPSLPLGNVKDMPKAEYEAMKRQTVRDLRRMG